MKKVCRVETYVHILAGLLPEQLEICAKCRREGWQLFPCNWCAGTGITQETRTYTGRYGKTLIIASKGERCASCYGTGQDVDHVKKLECGCLYRNLHWRVIKRCRLHTIGEHACCLKAKRRNCVCYEAFDCPVHGTKHVGTHD